MTKLCVLADTQTYHDWIRVPRAALTVHAGNFTRTGTIDECLTFLGWFGALPGMKVLVAGRRDVATEAHGDEFDAACTRAGVVYLRGERATIAGLRIWGGTAAPPSTRMDVDLLVTHEAPYGIGDRPMFARPGGSPLLLDRVRDLRPRAHVFCGSLREAGRHERTGVGTVFLNAAITPPMGLLRRPITHELRSPSPTWNEETAVTR